jgi:hypothetical protein
VFERFAGSRRLAGALTGRGLAVYAMNLRKSDEVVGDLPARLVHRTAPWVSRARWPAAAVASASPRSRGRHGAQAPAELTTT